MIICGCILGVLVLAWLLLCMHTRFWEEPIFSPGVLKRTLSHIWLRLYLPMFLFKVGLFTLDGYVCKYIYMLQECIHVGLYIGRHAWMNNPTLNRNIGEYNLNHIWDRVPFNTTGLKIGSSQNLVHIHNNGQAQINPPNRHPQIIIGHSEHALNSEHVFRES